MVSDVERKWIIPSFSKHYETLVYVKHWGKNGDSNDKDMLSHLPYSCNF
jgi:hypothetical protein